MDFIVGLCCSTGKTRARSKKVACYIFIKYKDWSKLGSATKKILNKMHRKPS